MSPALDRLLRVAGAQLASAALAIVASPALAGVIGTQKAVLVALVLTPILSGVEKALTVRRAARRAQ